MRDDYPETEPQAMGDGTEQVAEATDEQAPEAEQSTDDAEAPE